MNVFVEMTNLIVDRSNPDEPRVRIVDTNLYRIRGRKMSLSRLFTDRIIVTFVDFFLKKGEFLEVETS